MHKLAVAGLLFSVCASAAVFDVKSFGAKGDGKSPDRDPINRAIDAAAAAFPRW